IGTSETAIATGRAQLLLPRHLEQNLNASLLSRLGVAAMLAEPFKPEDAAAGIRHVCTSATVQEKAAAVAQAVAARPKVDVMERLAETCQALAG
ncbi:MAG TPA: hypothetical protein VFE52_08295, partial [Devosia sp.]|nr:hypothetical protein [Devosia sp.]